MKHFIYIPGLGDRFDPLRRLVLLRWKTDAKVTFVPMTWNDRKRTYEESYERICHAIAKAKGDEIILVGESAGGAMALYTFSRQRENVSRVITICGYNYGASEVNPAHKHLHPAFYALMPKVDEVVERLTPEMRARITTIYSTMDHVVTPRHSRIEGTREVVIHTPGHLMAITRILLAKSPISLTK